MNSPDNTTAILKSLIVYAICVPLAVFVGFLLTNPMNYSTLGTFGVMALLLFSPVLLRWHLPFLVFSLQLPAVLFFIKGAPALGLAMTALSLGISVAERMMNTSRHFIRVPQITKPLLFLGGVVLVTAKLTGGIGLHAFGSDVYGGKKYIFLLVGILLYFALSARRIPPERAGLFVTLYFAGGILSFITDLYPVTPSWATPIFWLFPPSSYGGFSAFGESRLGGFSNAGIALACLIMARYGIRGTLLTGKLWRPALFAFSILLVFLGGFRSQLLVVAFIFTIMFCLEGLHRTKLLPIFIFLGILVFVILIPIAPKLPFTFQRTLAFLPLHLDAEARNSAADSLDWRFQMWTALIPQVPKHLLLGKGLAISTEDFNALMGTKLGAAGGQFDPSQDPLALSFDYHNGPISVLIPFGIWGAIAFIWFIAAAVRLLHANHRYGDPALKTVNLFLFGSFLAALINFIFVGGGLSTDISRFTGIVGLSVALNGGMCEPEPQQAPKAEEAGPPSPARLRLQPTFQR